MKELFLKVWKDPVWSKVISVGIVALISLAFDSTRNFLWYYWHYPVIILLLCIIFLQRHFTTKMPSHLFEADKRTYERIQHLLCDSGLMERIRTDNFSSAFRNDIFELFDALSYEVNRNPIQYEFIDGCLNKQLQELFLLINEFGDYLSTNTWTTRNTEFSQIPPEWPEKSPNRFIETTQSISQLRRDVCKAYDEFTRQGRLQFGDLHAHKPNVK